MRRFVQISAARHGLRSPPGSCDSSTTKSSTVRGEGRGTVGRPVVGDADAIVNASALNLRAGPGTQYDVLAVMPKGARVHVTGATDAGFAPVTFGAVAGWAFEAYLTEVAPAEPIAIGSLADAVAALAA